MARAQEEMARKFVEVFGLPKDIDPHEAIIQEIARTNGMVAWLESKCREVTEEDIIGQEGVASVDDPAERKEARRRARAARQWISMYDRERDRLVAQSKIAIMCGIAERQLKLIEDYGQMIAAALDGILSELGIDATTDNVRLIMRKQLMLMAGDPAKDATDQ